MPTLFIKYVYVQKDSLIAEIEFVFFLFSKNKTLIHHQVFKCFTVKTKEYQIKTKHNIGFCTQDKLQQRNKFHSKQTIFALILT